MSPRRPPAFPVGALIRILVLVVLLVAIALTKHRCGVAFEGMFRTLESGPPADGGVGRDGGSS